MRRWVPWIVAVVLFWPLVTIFILGYRWSGEVVKFLSPASAIQSPASPSGSTFYPAPPAPAPPTPNSHQARPSAPSAPTDRDLERWSHEYVNELRR